MINYLEKNISKMQAGGIPPAGIDTQTLAQIMSAQGAGQGIDYNGEPTPNVSGQPSFADMAQEIQNRYDGLINPLQEELDAILVKLERFYKKYDQKEPDNIDKKTIANLEERKSKLESQIDQLEQQEDMELQQLEAEIEKSGQMIDQQKEMEGEIPPEGIPEYQMPQEEGHPVAEQVAPPQEMPMMQKGGNIPKVQIGEKISNWWKHTVVPAFTRDMGFEAPFSSDPHPYNAQDFVRDYNQAMEETPALSRIVQWNPIIGLGAGAMNLYSQAKGYRNDNEFLNNLSRATIGFMPAMKVASAPAALRGLTGYAGLNATANTYANQQLEKQGYAPTYDKGFSGLMNDAYGIPTWLGELGAMIYGGNKLGMRPGNLYSGGAPAGARAETIVQKVKNTYGANWRKIEGLDTYTDRTAAGNAKLWERLENGELEIIDNGNGGHVIREVKKPEVAAEPKFDFEKAPLGEYWKQRMKLAKNIFEPIYKPDSEWHFEWEKKGNVLGDGHHGRNIGKALTWTITQPFRLALHPTSYLADRLVLSPFHAERPGFLNEPFWKFGFSEVPYGKNWNNQSGWRKYFSYNWDVPKYHAYDNTVLNNRVVTPLISSGLLFGDKMRRDLNDLNEQLLNEQTEKSALPVQEQKNANVNNSDTIPYEMIDTTGRIGKRYYNPETDTWYQTGGIVKKHQNDPIIGDDTEKNKWEKAKEKWYADFKNNYIKNHPVGLAGFLKETPYTEYGVWGNAIGKLIDDSGRHNIEAQNQFRYNSNPYTAVYDRANRDYNDALNMANARYNLRENMLRRMQPVQEYGSLQQAQNARLAQQTLLNQQIAQNENDRNSAIASIQGSYGKSANDAYTSMREQDYKNTILNENLRKTYLQSLDTYRKEKQAQFDQLINMAAITGNRRKQADLFNAEFVPNLLNAAIAGVDYSDLLKLYQ